MKLRSLLRAGFALWIFGKLVDWIAKPIEEYFNKRRA